MQKEEAKKIVTISSTIIFTIGLIIVLWMNISSIRTTRTGFNPFKPGYISILEGVQEISKEDKGMYKIDNVLSEYPPFGEQIAEKYREVALFNPTLIGSLIVVWFLSGAEIIFYYNQQQRKLKFER